MKSEQFIWEQEYCIEKSMQRCLDFSAPPRDSAPGALFPLAPLVTPLPAPAAASSARARPARISLRVPAPVPQMWVPVTCPTQDSSAYQNQMATDPERRNPLR